MTNAQSKFLQTVTVSCKDFNHPWTNHCVNASAGLLLAATPYCLRVYTVVYALSLLMRHRIPTLTDLKRTFFGILQSTAFLVTNSFTFIMYNCILRRLLGFYHVSTVAFLPSFLASLTAILVERPARRPLLALYVANVATEALWNMGVTRGFLKSLPYGQSLVFSVGISILLYIYRLGLHKNKCKDSIFNMLRIFVGSSEEGPIKTFDPMHNINTNSLTPRATSFTNISSFVQFYSQVIDKLKSKHFSCLHKEACYKYCLKGGVKPFLGGVVLQIALKLVMNAQKIVYGQMNWRKSILNSNILSMGAFLGGFSFTYKSISCILRHFFGYDDPRFALPASGLASICFR